jgi:tetratricopeptide (TPR) repeat protein
LKRSFGYFCNLIQLIVLLLSQKLSGNLLYWLEIRVDLNCVCRISSVMKYLFISALIASPVFADTCPPAKDYSAELAELAIAANKASDEREGRIVSDKMWDVWLRAPDEASQKKLDYGMRQRARNDFTGAYQSFDSLVSYCPLYAEGYNQRAFISYLTKDYAAALDDLNSALRLSPNHVAAQSGRALTLMNLGQLAEARLQLQAALKNNPWLSERALLDKGAPLAIKGEDI